MSIKGLLFDFDGLILDTEMPEFQVWEEIYNSFGVKLPLDLWLQNIGTTDHAFDVVSYLEEKSSKDGFNREIIIARHRELFDKKIKSEKPLPGVEEYINKAKELGIKVAVATSSPRSWVGGHLSRLNMLNSFDGIVSSDDVEYVKPSPDIYLHALAIMHINPDEAIAIEDSHNGIIAAKSAGIYCVAVPNMITEHLDLSRADLIVKSLTAISLEKLIELVVHQHTVSRKII
jgi:HAD superfamily hydrolase (TIGR01509 family)